MNAIAIINIAKTQLGMQEPDYRALLKRTTGVDSLKAMSERQKLTVIAEMKRLGFKMKRGNKTIPTSPKPYIRLIHALWKSCARHGVISDGSRKALRAFVKARSPKEDPDFLTYDEASPIIEALKAMEARASREAVAK